MASTSPLQMANHNPVIDATQVAMASAALEDSARSNHMVESQNHYEFLLDCFNKTIPHLQKYQERVSTIATESKVRRK